MGGEVGECGLCGVSWGGRKGLGGVKSFRGGI